MRTLITFILISTSYLSLAQPGFIKILGHPFPQCYMTNLAVDKDTIITFSSAIDTLLNTQGILFQKFDKNGNFISSNLIAERGHLLTTYIISKPSLKTEDGGYCKVGSGWRTDTSDVTFNYFIKVDHDLKLESLKYFDFSNFEAPFFLTTLCETKDGFLIAQENNKYQTTITKTDKLGNIQWRKNYGEPNLFQTIEEIKKIDDNTFIVSGGSATYINEWEWIDHSFDFFAIDSLGNIKWFKQLFATDENEYDYGGISDFQKLPDGGWIFCGSAEKYSENVDGIANQSYILRVDKDFNILWEKGFYDVHLESFFRSLEKTVDGNFIATGQNFGVETIHHKFNIDGETIWSRRIRIGESYYFNHFSLGLLSDGSIVSCGSDVSGEGEHRGLYGFLIKMTNDGCIDISECPDWVAVEDISKEQIDIDIFPNPASDYVSFNKVNEVLQKPIDIEIFDVMGRKVKNTTIPIFEQNINLDISTLLNGVYFCRFYQDDTLLFVKKLIKQ